MRLCSCSLVALCGLLWQTSARAQDGGALGRLEGDLMVGAEVGVTETIGDETSRGESMAARVTVLYMSTVGVFGQYNESFSIASQPVARSVVGGFELRPLFVGRWSQNMEHGPPHLDLWLDSFSLTLGLYNLWRQPRFCTPPRGCHDVGMELSLGMELPLLPQANTPFIALRGALRWSLEDLGGPHGAPDGAPDGAPHGGPHGAPPPMGLITLTLGYHHLFETHLVDAADSIPP